MRIRQLSLIATATAIVLLAASLAVWYVQFRSIDAPEARFKTLTGDQFNTSELRGKVVLVNFWATSCVTCMAEMPKMIETYNLFKANGLETVAVAMDYDPPNFVLAYAEQKKLPFRVSLDIDGAVARAFGNVRLTPTTFLIDRRGHVVRQYLGEPDFRQLQALLREKLAEPA